MNHKQNVSISQYFYSIALLFLIIFAMRQMQFILAPLCFSLIFTIILQPLSAFFERIGLSRIVASFFTVSIITLLMITVILVVTWQASVLIETYNLSIQRIETMSSNKIEELESAFPIFKHERVVEYRKKSSDLFKAAATRIGSSVSGAVSLLSDILLMPIFVFFLLAYRRFLTRFLHKATKSSEEKVTRILRNSRNVLRSYLSGLLVVMCIMFVFNFIGMLIFNVPYAWACALLASTLLVIPYIGVFIGSAIPLVLLVIDGAYGNALGIVLWMASMQAIEGNFITPKIVGSQVSINPFAAIIALLLGGKIWGISGVILAIPMIAVLKVLLDNSKRFKPYGWLLGEVHEQDEQDDNLDLMESGDS